MYLYSQTPIVASFPFLTAFNYTLKLSHLIKGHLDKHSSYNSASAWM